MCVRVRVCGGGDRGGNTKTDQGDRDWVYENKKVQKVVCVCVCVGYLSLECALRAQDLLMCLECVFDFLLLSRILCKSQRMR